MNIFRHVLQPRGLLLAMHLPFVWFTAAQAIAGLGLGDAEGHRWIALPFVLAAGVIQARHSLGAADGVRPRQWQLTLVLLLFITYLPLPLFTHRWLTLHWYLIASLLILLPGRVALAAAVTDAVGIAVWNGTSLGLAGLPAPQVPLNIVYGAFIWLTGGGSLYGAARLVWLASELRGTRTQLADLAIERERLRISRDLHDLLGHSLSAVALKGELAQRLIERQQMSRADEEIQSLVSVARAAFRDLREVTRREPVVSLASQIDRCTDILAAVGIEPRVTQPVETLPPKVDELFAWAVREGVTNVVRHSSARACAIFIGRAAGQWRLEIENDGAGVVAAGGHGLSGLVTRAAELSGTARGRSVGPGSFLLTVDVPEEVR
ncbi:MAG TPA: histidine kinase [Vicinamibacterales bacterium]|nr:histidine kinase [Vicinamibacterales bacterium]